MYVCLCHGVTERDIESAVDSGARSLKDLSRSLRVATQCGKCCDHAKGCLQESLQSTELKQQACFAAAVNSAQMVRRACRG